MYVGGKSAIVCDVVSSHWMNFVRIVSFSCNRDLIKLVNNMFKLVETCRKRVSFFIGIDQNAIRFSRNNMIQSNKFFLYMWCVEEAKTAMKKHEFYHKLGAQWPPPAGVRHGRRIYDSWRVFCQSVVSRNFFFFFTAVVRVASWMQQKQSYLPDFCH